MRCICWQFTLSALVYVAAVFRAGAEPALTIYNQEFAVVRETIPLELKQGTNNVRFSDITAHVEPDSVMLRDPSGKQPLQILEQNYRSDPISDGLLLSVYEGKTIDFLVQRGDVQEVVQGKIIRSGYVPHQMGLQRYGQDYRQQQVVYAGSAAGQPIVEVDGKVRFGLPGTPLFPALADDTILKPTLNWVLETDRAGALNAELSYVTGGMTWEADYNLVSPEKGDSLDVIGWVTLDNQSGRTFENARIKLVAGDVSKLRRSAGGRDERGDMNAVSSFGGPMQPPVTEKSFDEYHLYTLRLPTTLHDRETKQVEFVRASDVKSARLYVYDGAKIDSRRYRDGNERALRENQEYGTEMNTKVWVMREFENKKENNLGIALPKGRLRFYRRNDDGQLEFTGENLIDHTPEGELARVYTGNAFDLVGKRIRTTYKIDGSAKWLDESFTLTLANHKKETVEIRVVEHLYRWINWEIVENSNAYNKTDSQTMEFRIQLAPDEEKTVTYKVRYTW